VLGIQEDLQHIFDMAEKYNLPEDAIPEFDHLAKYLMGSYPSGRKGMCPSICYFQYFTIWLGIKQVHLRYLNATQYGYSSNKIPFS
jgi:hypothetical protein